MLGSYFGRYHIRGFSCSSLLPFASFGLCCCLSFVISKGLLNTGDQGLTFMWALKEWHLECCFDVKHPLFLYQESSSWEMHNRAEGSWGIVTCKCREGKQQILVDVWDVQLMPSENRDLSLCDSHHHLERGGRRRNAGGVWAEVYKSTCYAIH